MSLLTLLLSIAANCQPFDFPSSPSRPPGLQVAGTGKIYTSAGNQLYRLNSNLQLEETGILTSDAVNISPSSDGSWLVVCLTDLSCEVYNATNFSAVFRQDNVIESTENIALFAVEDSFYVGSIPTSGGIQQRIVLGQFRFDDSQHNSANSYMITRNSFARHFYDSGFVRGNNTYYFATDNEPRELRSVKVMRVCHNSDFSALYELALACGGRTPSGQTRISGVSAVDNFPGMSGPAIVLSINRPLPSRSTNLVCLYSLEAIDNRMQEKFNSCNASSVDQIALSWRTIEPLCSGFSVS